MRKLSSYVLYGGKLEKKVGVGFSCRDCSIIVCGWFGVGFFDYRFRRRVGEVV